NEFADEAFLRRMGYRARLELPTPGAYGEIFRRAAALRGLVVDHESVSSLLHKYGQEGRPMKSCEPRDRLNRISGIWSLEGRALQVSPALIDAAWGNYFGTAHGFATHRNGQHAQAHAVSA